MVLGHVFRIVKTPAVPLVNLFDQPTLSVNDEVHRSAEGELLAGCFL